MENNEPLTVRLAGMAYPEVLEELGGSDSGDTLALFILRELQDVDSVSSPLHSRLYEAIRAMEQAGRDICRVGAVLAAAWSVAEETGAEADTLLQEFEKIRAEDPSICS